MGHETLIGLGRPTTAGRQRAAIAAVQVLGLAVWFSVSAVVPGLREVWGIGTSGAVWLTGSTQIGFVVGAVGSPPTSSWP